jgi:hypothetical protein
MLRSTFECNLQPVSGVQVHNPVLQPICKIQFAVPDRDCTQMIQQQHIKKQLAA